MTYKAHIKYVYITIITTFVSLQTSFSQEKKVLDKKNYFEISGSTDIYFRSNLNGENTLHTSDANIPIVPYSSFANLPGFSLGMLNVIGTYTFKSATLVADLGFGPRATEAVFNSVGSSNIINQLYISLALSEKITLTFGNFNTFLGYEVISPAGNFNYSTSYLFSNGPFSHTGLKANFDLGSNFTLMAAIMNQTDFTEVNPFDDYVGGLQLGYSADKSSIYLNGIISDGFYQLDITAGTNITEKTYVGLNTSIAEDAYSGLAFYLQQEINNKFSLGLRIERFIPNTGSANTNYTLTGKYKIGNLTIIPEIRLDKATDSDYFLTKDISVRTNNLSSFILAAVYEF